MLRAPCLFLLSALAFGCGGTTNSGSASGGQTGAGGTTGGGSGALGCTKICDGNCVSPDDPTTGCGSTSCEPCNTPHAASTCSEGKCAIGTCEPGYADCDIDTLLHHTTGCETHVAFDPLHCGACGAACTSSGGNVACIDSKCQPSSCPIGLADCTGQGNCSTSLATLENCGVCGNACTSANATVDCAPTPGGIGTCVYECLPGFADCDAIQVNGCETNLATDLGNCGTCGMPCPSGPNSTSVCVDGACVLVCERDFSNCDEDLANGCETHAPTC